MTEFFTVTAPAYWASYFVNGDASGLTADEKANADAWLEREQVEIIDVVRDDDGDFEARFTWSFGIHAPECGVSGGDVLDYLARPLEEHRTMTAVQHTPGPWTAHDSASQQSDSRDDMFDWSSHVDCIAPYVDSDDSDQAGITIDEQTVAHGHGRTAKEAIANARLIAAAPELLSALQTLVDDAWEYNEEDKLWSISESTVIEARAAIAKAAGK